MRVSATTGLVPVEFKIDRPPHIKGDVVGLAPDVAERLADRGVVELVEPGGDSVEVGEKPRAVAPPEVPFSEREKIEIPANWAGLHKLQLVRLASEITGRDVEADAASAIIATEMRRRGRYVPPRDASVAETGSEIERQERSSRDDENSRRREDDAPRAAKKSRRHR